MRMFYRCIDIAGCIAGGMMVWNYYPQLDTRMGLIYFIIGIFLLGNSMLRIMRYR